MFSSVSLSVAALLAMAVGESRVAAILSILQDRPTAIKSTIYPDTSVANPQAEQLKCAIQTACIQSVFYEYKDAYLAELDRTPLEFDRIGNRDNFMRYVLEQEQSQELLDRFIPGLTNMVQGSVAVMRSHGQWPVGPAQTGITFLSFSQENYSDSLGHCMEDAIATRVAADVTEVHNDVYLTNVASTRTYGGWERSPNSGIRPIVMDNPGAVYAHVSELRASDPDSVVTPRGGATASHVNFTGSLADFIRIQGERL